MPTRQRHKHAHTQRHTHTLAHTPAHTHTLAHTQLHFVTHKSSRQNAYKCRATAQRMFWSVTSGDGGGGRKAGTALEHEGSSLMSLATVTVTTTTTRMKAATAATLAA